MEDGKPDRKSRYALWGTAAHAICEQCIAEGKKPTDWEIGSVVKGVPDVCIDQEMINACETALAQMQEITKGASLKTECWVKMPGIPDMRGVIDVLADEASRLTVLDYKFGAGVKVTAKDNPQLMAYALMAAGNTLADYESIRLVVVQPRVSGQADVWEFPPSELAHWRDEIFMPTVDAILSGRVEYHPDPDTCRWCRGKDDCRAYAVFALESVRAETSHSPDPLK